MRNAIKQFIQNFKKDERGLTLVELLAVVVILGIVGLIAFVSIGNVIDNSKKDAHIANAQQIISAVELYEASGGDIEDEDFEFPTSLDTLGSDFVDPWNRDADDYLTKFEISKTEGTIVIDSSHSKCTFKNGAKSKVELAENGRDICQEIKADPET